MNKILAKLAEKWLIKSSIQDSSRPRLSKIQAEALVFDMNERGIVFHSPSKRNRAFRVKLGNPKMRARRHLTLPAHSLVLNLYEPTNVSIMPDEQGYEEWWDLRRRLSFRREDVVMSLSLHPHISGDGNPCLGDFGRAWSTAINSGNIVALTNVANGFLDTWTRRDCFWDINSAHRGYEQSGQMQGRRGMPFKAWLYYSNMARSIANDLNKTLIMRHFDSWMYQDDTLEKLESMGVSWEKALMAYTVYKSTLRLVQDTEDEEVSRMHNWHSKLEWLYTDTSSNILDDISNKHRLNGYAWVEEALTGAKSTSTHPFSTDRVMSIPNALDGLKYRFSQFRHIEEEHHPSIEVVLNARTRIYLTPDNIHTSLYMNNAQVNRVVGEWVHRSAGMARPLKSEAYRVLHFMWRIREFGNLFKQAVDKFNPSQMMAGWIEARNDDNIRPVTKRERMGEEYRAVINQMGTVLDNYDTSSLRTEFGDKFQVESLELFSNHLKALYKGVSDDRRKKQIDAYGEPTRPNRTESQLSLETF